MTNSQTLGTIKATNPVLAVAPLKEETEMLRAIDKITALYCRLSVEDMKEDKKGGKEDVSNSMLSFLTLSDKHRENLLERGLSDERIERNGYRSMPETPQARRLLAKLVGSSHDLLGIPGFYTRDAQWTVAGPNGFLIPVRNQDGLIQGLKIRLDDADKPGRKYRWLSSRDRHLENGTRSYSWIKSNVFARTVIRHIQSLLEVRLLKETVVMFDQAL